MISSSPPANIQRFNRRKAKEVNVQAAATQLGGKVKKTPYNNW